MNSDPEGTSWLSLSTETGLHSANCAADRGDLTGTVLVLVVDAPVVVQRQVSWLGRAENCGVSAVAVLVGLVEFLDKVVVPVGTTTGVAQCLVRRWIHVIIQNGFWKTFDDFLREGVDSAPELDSRPARLAGTSSTTAVACSVLELLV